MEYYHAAVELEVLLILHVMALAMIGLVFAIEVLSRRRKRARAYPRPRRLAQRR